MGAGASTTEKTPLLAITSASPQKAEGGPDYSMMSICSGDVKKFEYMLFIGAEACRLVYSDVGIIRESLKGFGLSPDILNKVITHYDWKFLSKKRNITARVSGSFAPPESYELQACPDGIDHAGQPVLVRYISSPTDTTCMVVSPNALKPNPNTIITASDCIVVFKGSSSLRNWEKNLRSVAPGDFSATIASVVPSGPPGLMVAASFVVPIVEIFENTVESMEKVCPGATRIFVFGHSKGGAEAELAGAMLALKFPEKEIHIISYGAPKIIAPTSKDAFDNFFFTSKQGKFTLTRVESVGALTGDNVTDIPPGIMVHPGWGTKTNTLDFIRSQHGVSIDNGNKRNAATWPFAEPMDLWDIKNKLKLDAEVQRVIGEAPTVASSSVQGGANYIRVRGSAWAPYPHMEYFGMFFMGSQRLAGMGNPAKTQGDRKEIAGSDVNKTFVANIYNDCSKYQYVPWVSRGSALDFVDDGARLANVATQQFIETRDKVQGYFTKKGGRRTPRKHKSRNRTTRK